MTKTCERVCDWLNSFLDCWYFKQLNWDIIWFKIKVTSNIKFKIKLLNINNNILACWLNVHKSTKRFMFLMDFSRIGIVVTSALKSDSTPYPTRQNRIYKNSNLLFIIEHLLIYVAYSPSFNTFSFEKTAFPKANNKLSGAFSASAITSKINTRSRSESWTMDNLKVDHACEQKWQRMQSLNQEGLNTQQWSLWCEHMHACNILFHASCSRLQDVYEDMQLLTELEYTSVLSQLDTFVVSILHQIQLSLLATKNHKLSELSFSFMMLQIWHNNLNFSSKITIP